MANESQLIDYSLDPLQVEEDTLNQRLKAAIAKSLRNVDSIPNWNIGGQTTATFDRVSGQLEIPQIQAQRQALGQKFENSMAEALRGQPDNIRRLSASPGTRAIGLDLLKQRSKEQLDQEAMDRAFGSSGSALPGATGQGEAPSYAQLVELQSHPNAKVAAAAKARLEAYYKPHDPKLNVRYNPQGGFEPIAGADAAYARTQGAIQQQQHPMGVQIPSGDGGTMMVQPPRPPSALPGATGAAVAPPVPTPAPMPASGPISPASAPPGPTPPAAPGVGGLDAILNGIYIVESGGGKNNYNPKSGALGPYQFMPGTVAQLAKEGLVFNPMDPEQARAAAGKLLTKYIQETGSLEGGLAKYGGFVNKDPREYVNKVLSAAGIGSAQAQPGVDMRERPSGPPGTTPPPSDVALHQKTRESDLKGLDEYEKAVGDPIKAGRAYAELKRLNQKGLYEGAQSVVFPLVEQASTLLPGGGKMSQKYADSREFETKVLSLAGPLAKQLGYNPSNVDLNTALAQLPKGTDDTRTRDQILDLLIKGMEYEAATQVPIRKLVEGGMAVREAQQVVDKWYRGQKEGAGNPTQAGGSALPSATAAQPPAPPSPPSALPSATGQINPAELLKREPQNDLEKRMKMSMLQEPGADMTEGLGQNIANVAKAPFTKGGWEGFGQAQKNVLTGVGQLLGMSDRGEWKAEKARQDARSAQDPYYAAGRTFGSVFNPTALFGGGAATTLGKLTVAGATQAGLAPQETAGEQAIEAAKGGALGFSLGAVAKFFPTFSSSVPNLREYLDKFKSVQATSPQLNPRGLDSFLARTFGVNDAATLSQVQALTKDLMAKAGMKDTTVSRKIIEDGLEAKGKMFDKLFPNITVTPKISTAEQQALKDSLTTSIGAQGGPTGVEAIMNNAKAPNLGQIYTLLTSKNPIQINPKVLHEAWKEIGDVATNPQAAMETRKLLENIIVKTMSPEKAAAFKKLNEEYGNLLDIKRIYEAGGEGAASAAGTLTPSALERNMNTGPFAGSATDEAGDLVKRLGLRDYREAEITGGGLGNLAIMLGHGTVGKGVQAADRIIQSVPDSAKRVAEMLRNWGVQGALGANRERVNNAP